MSQQDDLRQELADQFTDQALREVLGGRRPPDLTARILSAAQPARRWQSRRRQLELAAMVLLSASVVAGYVVHLRNQKTVARGIAKQPATRQAKSDVVQVPDEPEPIAVSPRDEAVAPKPTTQTVQEQLALLVDEFNQLMHEKRYAEAEVVSQRAAKLAPDALVVQQLKNTVKLVSLTERYRSIRREREEGFVASLNSVEESAIPFDDDRPYRFGDRQHLTKTRTAPSRTYPVADRIGSTPAPPILYPDAELWRMLTERRKKYKAVDLTEHSPKETRIIQALDEKTDLDFGEQPLTDVVEYLKQRHGVEIQLDDKVLADAGMGSDMPITRRIKGVTLRSALKLLLGELDLTYVIRNDVLMITTKTRAEELLSDRVTQGLRTVVWLNYQDAPLKQVVDDLSKLLNVPIYLDFESAAKEKVTGDTRITIKLTSEVSAKSALDLVLKPLHLGFCVDDALLRIGSESDYRPEPLSVENHDRYARIIENPFLGVIENPLSTFGVDVDTASYAKVRRYLLQEGELPPPDAVRIEELVNYFDYDYAPPDGELPFAAHVELATCPWQPEHRLLRIGLKGREVPEDERPATNLVFLLDVSGSMKPDDKLPRAVRAMRLLAEKLRENDRVAIVVYAGESGLALPSTTGFQKDRIASVLDGLHAGGSTNGASGIRLAYDTAQEHFIKGGTNRIILCTDGDFNVGTTSTGELERLIEERAKGGVFLTVLGFGMGNHNDELMEKLADKGNGNYGYIDSEAEARKLLVEQAGSTLVTIAKDVKVQLEFNPRLVAAYRLIGYEDRLLQPEDFNDDKKDAGDIGAGHTVTALYEIIPARQAGDAPKPDEPGLKYQRPAELTVAAAGDELLTLKLKYKKPDSQKSEEALIVPVRDSTLAFDRASPDFRFVAAVAGLGLLLRDSQFKGSLTFDSVIETAEQAMGRDPHGRRGEFLQIVRKARELDARRAGREKAP
ncbi:MAG TPA: VWA domain-containing protein [Pirellulales bacterium]|nr:VWA domain-containing protein [Pirellulales bacterium]